MGTSITVPQHVQNQFARKRQRDPHKQSHSLPASALKNDPFRFNMNPLKGKQNQQMPTKDTKIGPKIAIKAIRQHVAPITRKEEGLLQAQNLPSISINNPQLEENHSKLSKSSFSTERTSSILATLSKEGLQSFRKASLKRKISPHYRSVMTRCAKYTQIKVDDVLLLGQNHQNNEDSKEHKSSFPSQYYSEPTKAPKSRIKLKAIYKEEVVGSHKKRVNLYLQNSEGTYI